MTKRALLPFALLCTSLAAQAPATPKAQTPPDQKAYNAARATADPAQKLAALRQFQTDFPDSTRKGSAQALIFSTLLEHFPDRTAEIDEQAKLQIKGDKNYAKWSAEARTALRLAFSQPAGADLSRAREFADDALKNETEPKVSKAYLAYFKDDKDKPKPAEVHTYYTDARGYALAASAAVAYRQGNLTLAKAQADEAYTLAPSDSDVNAVRGELAFAEHRNADALTAFERAQVTGSLSKPDRAHLATLFAEANPTGDLEATLDTTYRQLYPDALHPAAHTPAPGGHTAMLELYTGSGCPPCVGGDLAVEAILDSHPRTEVVALAYDLHIPRPDPLTSADTVARAAWYKVSSTPNYVLDGQKLDLYGAYREGAGDLYAKLVKAVDEQTAKPSAVKLQLTTTPGAGGTITAQASVILGDPASLAQPSLPVLTPDPAAKKPAAAPVPAAKAPANPHYILNFALVEDDVRYSGENGVRFHRMVVRALARPSAEGFPLEPGKAVTLDASFDPAAIAQASRTYLETYEKSNDRFGPIEFLAKPTAADPTHLAIAAWVQDTETHRILQSAFFPLTSITPQAGTR